MAIVAQLVRAPACGAGGRRFESGLSPHFFCLKVKNYKCLTDTDLFKYNHYH